MPVLEDNQGTLALAENPLGSAQSQYTCSRALLYVRGLLRSNDIDLKCVASQEQHADIATKSIAAAPFEQCRSHRSLMLNLPLESE